MAYEEILVEFSAEHLLLGKNYVLKLNILLITADATSQECIEDGNPNQHMLLKYESKAIDLSDFGQSEGVHAPGP